MMSVSPLNTSSTTGTSGTSKTTTASNELGPDSFLKLMIAELQNQDPLDPMDTQGMMSQLSQMTMVTETRSARQSQDMTQALSMLGRTVVWEDSETGNQYQGEVSGVQRDGSDAKLLVGNETLSLGDIIGVF